MQVLTGKIQDFEPLRFITVCMMNPTNESQYGVAFRYKQFFVRQQKPTMGAAMKNIIPSSNAICAGVRKGVIRNDSWVSV